MFLLIKEDTFEINTESLSNETVENIFNDALRHMVYEFERDLDFKYGL